jgi:glycerophosphoryl diester phosphodiesterase
VTGPLVIAHRGASAAYPENTLAAFRGAAALGADWVELDVWRAADGALVVRHDAELPDGRPVADVAAGDLPDDVPVLPAALAACEGMGVNVEVKPHPDLAVVEPVAEVVRAWGGPVLVSSFDPAIVERVRAVAPDVPTAQLVVPVDDPGAVVAACVAAGHVALHPWNPTVDEDLVRRCHEAGLALNTWTVDDPDRMLELAGWGVDGIVTNVPDVARTLFSRQ